MNIQDVTGWVWSAVIAGIFLAVGVLVLAEFRTSLSAGDQQATIDNVTLAMTNVSKQFPTAGTVIGVLLILGAVMGLVYFGGRKMGYAR